MRIVNIQVSGQRRLGFLDGNAVVDALTAGGSDEVFASTTSLIAAGDAGKAAAAALIASGKGRIPSVSAKLLAPMLPSTILCSGSNYRDHNKEKANTEISGKEPEFFIKTSDCVVGPGDTIVLDEALTKKLDGETELAVVIGKPGRHIPAEKGLEHVWGYTIINDVTARDRQVRMRDGFTWYELGRGKAFDSSAPMGPCIVTTDEIPDPQVLRVRTRVNGEPRQDGNTAEMIWTVAQLVHFFSVNFTLRPGMMIITGTPAGTAWSTDKELGGKWQPTPGLVPAKGYLQRGDRFESEIEKIGVLVNRIG